MAAAKEAMVAIEHVPGLDIVRVLHGHASVRQGLRRYVNRARDEQRVKFIRAMPSRLVEMPDTR